MDTTSVTPEPAPGASSALERPAPAGAVEPLSRVPWIAVAVFAVLACGLAWLVQLPVWLSGEGLRSPLFLPLTAAMMGTPAVAALIVTFAILRPARPARFLGLTLSRPIWPSIVTALVWPVFWLVLGVLAVLIAAVLGWVHVDLTFGAVRATLPDGMDVTTAIMLSLLSVPLNVLVSSVPAFGEELGWRGFLHSALAPLGFWRAAGVSGVLWGVWHAPIILLGYNFLRPDLLGLLMMCGFTLCVGVFLHWSRAVCRNVYVAAIGHGALNTVTPLTLMALPMATTDPFLGTVLGLPGWLVMALATLAMAGFGAFRTLGRRAASPRPSATNGGTPTPEAVSSSRPGSTPAQPR